jgi:hypothetical protein
MRALKLIIRMEVNLPEAEYTEFAEREFDTEGDLRDAYNHILDSLEDTEPAEPPEQFGPGYPKSESNPGGY